MCEFGFFAEAYVAEKGAVVEHHRPLRLHLSRGSRICLCTHRVLCVSWPCVFLLPSLGYRLVKSEIAPELTRRKGGPKPVPFKLLHRLVDHQYRELGKGDGDAPPLPRVSPTRLSGGLELSAARAAFSNANEASAAASTPPPPLPSNLGGGGRCRRWQHQRSSATITTKGRVYFLPLTR